MTTSSTTLTCLGKPEQGISLRFNVPELFQREDFVKWLKLEKGVATWDDKSSPTVGEYSDVFLLVDGSLSGEGSDDGGLMPPDIWDSIVQACKEALGDRQFDENITVRLTNLV